MHTTQLATSGEGGYPCYRIPALVVTPAGTLLAAYDGRPNPDDLPGPIDLLLRRSHDNGDTWEPQEVLRTGVGLEGFGDPSFIIDHDTGTILAFHATGTLAGFFEAVEGWDPPDLVQHVGLSVSDDDGRTWTHRIITDQLKRPGVSGIFAASGTGTQVRAGRFKGRLVQPMVLRDHDQITAAAIFSDDHGETWTLSAPIGVGTDESAVAALAEGRLLMHSRSVGHRLASYSEDGGATWSAPQPIKALPDPSDNGSLIVLSQAADGGGPRAVLLASSNLDPSLRRNTALSISHDGGETWPHQLVLQPGSSAYSCAAQLPDGRIGVLYEEDAYTRITFTSVALAEIEESGPADPVQAGIACPDDPMLEVIREAINPAPPPNWDSASDTSPGAAGGVDTEVWHATAARFGAAGRVCVATRDAQRRLFGAPKPGLRAGDTLLFNARVRMPEDEGVNAVVLEHPGGATEPRDIPPGGQATYFRLPYTVTDKDARNGVVSVQFLVPTLALSQELVFDTRD